METQTKLRIHVGGLGESVTEEDIQNTFSKSGKVEAVEFVRTKGRSFAYIDFLPSSDKSVAKLFSTYNGCAWKGGKLKLEKAKLHYLERLKREWAEDADLDNKKHDDNDANNMVSSVEHEEALDESSQIHMFFPRLRKLKALPYKGTGKHKYSFQRIEASAHPIYFCDCAEHARNYNTIKEVKARQASMKDGGMNQDEINLMNSVLHKFLKGTDAPTDHLPDDHNHNDDSTDDDNIIINAVAGPNDMTHLLESMKKQTGSQHKNAKSKKLQNSGNGLSRNNIRSQKGKGMNSSRNGKVEGSGKKVEFSILNRKQTQSERQTEPLRADEKSASKQFTGFSSNEAPESGAAHIPSVESNAVSFSNVMKHEKVLNEPVKTEPNNLISDNPARVTAQSRKSAWAQKFNFASNSSFSLLQILSESKVSNSINDSVNSAVKRKRENVGDGCED